MTQLDVNNIDLGVAIAKALLRCRVKKKVMSEISVVRYSQ